MSAVKRHETVYELKKPQKNKNKRKTENAFKTITIATITNLVKGMVMVHNNSCLVVRHDQCHHQYP